MKEKETGPIQRLLQIPILLYHRMSPESSILYPYVKNGFHIIRIFPFTKGYQKMTERHGRSVVFSYVFTCSMISKQSSVSAILNSLGLSFGLTLVLWRTR